MPKHDSQDLGADIRTVDIHTSHSGVVLTFVFHTIVGIPIASKTNNLRKIRQVGNLAIS